jgi:aminoglycoside phosphotransferase (APT) family kinase protein
MSPPDLLSLGLLSWAGCDIGTITARHGSAVYRLSQPEHHAILKVYTQETEANAYRLLGSLAIPILQMHQAGPNWILLEDLEASLCWRLAEPRDVDLPETGAALAGWYRTLHGAGATLLAKQSDAPAFLKRQCDSITEASVMDSARRLGMADLAVWGLVTCSLELLKMRFQSFAKTLNYNDFHWTNLALSRERPVRAIVFDYHLLGIGPIWSDIRNVCGSLGPAARETFLESYGEVDDSPAVFDSALSILYSLNVASRLEQLPTWAMTLIKRVGEGDLEALLRQALEMCEG